MSLRACDGGRTLSGLVCEPFWICSPLIDGSAGKDYFITAGTRLTDESNFFKASINTDNFKL